MLSLIISATLSTFSMLLSFTSIFCDFLLPQSFLCIFFTLYQFTLPFLKSFLSAKFILCIIYDYTNFLHGFILYFQYLVLLFKDRFVFVLSLSTCGFICGFTVFCGFTCTSTTYNQLYTATINFYINCMLLNL